MLLPPPLSIDRLSPLDSVNTQWFHRPGGTFTHWWAEPARSESWMLHLRPLGDTSTSTRLCSAGTTAAGFTPKGGESILAIRQCCSSEWVNQGLLPAEAEISVRSADSIKPVFSTELHPKKNTAITRLTTLHEIAKPLPRPQPRFSSISFPACFDEQSKLLRYRAANVTATGAAYSKAHYVAREDDTSRTGAVYVFSRLVSPSDDDGANGTSTPVCAEDVSDDSVYGGLHVDRRRFYCPSGGERGHGCEWQESAKFVASDRRGGDLFGRSLSVDHDGGVVVVGAPGASLTGLWREVRQEGCEFKLCFCGNDLRQ